MLKLVLKLIPTGLKRSLYNAAIKLIRAAKKHEMVELPKPALAPKHLENAKMVATREDMLELMPKNGIVAELGVDYGGFSEKILNINQPGKLHLVDMWGDKRYNQEKRRNVENKFSQQIQNGQLEINIGLSTDVAAQFEDAYFDWIYIDTDHTYQVTKDELEAYQSKVKPNGIIAGHDYIVGNWKAWFRYGVIEAVHEFCVAYNWEILYISMETNIPPSFAIRKLA